MCQRTQPYSVNVESNKCIKSKVYAIRAYNLHLHDGAICNLSTLAVEHNRRSYSRGRTTNAASIYIICQWLKWPTKSLSTYQYGPKDTKFRSTVDSIIEYENTKSGLEVCLGYYERISNTLDKDRSGALIIGNDVVIYLGDKQRSGRFALLALITTHHPSQRRSGVLYRT